MKKYLILFLLIALLVPFVINAQRVEIENPLGGNSTLWSLIDKVINFVFYLAIPIAALMIVVSGYFFLISAGDPAKVKTAKDIILYALIGLVVVFLSKAIIGMLAGIFGIKIPS